MFAGRRVTLVTVFVASMLPSVGQAQSGVVGFKMPSNNIYCMLEPPYQGHPGTDLRCDIEQMTSKPPPTPKDCPLSWGDAFAIAESGDEGVRICHGDTTRDDELPVLCKQVLDEQLTDGKVIKQRVKNWRPDFARA